MNYHNAMVLCLEPQDDAEQEDSEVKVKPEYSLLRSQMCHER